MRNIKVALLLANVQFASDIARRLSEISGGMEITVISDDSCLSEGQWDLIVTDEMIDLGNPVSFLYQKILDLYNEKMGNKSELNLSKGAHITSFISFTGGSGTSAISLTFARILSSRYNRKVLYICTDTQDDSFVYFDSEYTKRHSYRELSYLVENGIEYGLGDYLNTDNYGVSFVAAGLSAAALVNSIKDSDRFNEIIIDYGKNTISKALGDTILVINGTDSRHSKQERDNRFKAKIRNKSNAFENRENEYYIPMDETSFEKTSKGDDGVIIKMDGVFSLSVSKVVSDLFRVI